MFHRRDSFFIIFIYLSIIRDEKVNNYCRRRRCLPFFLPHASPSLCVTYKSVFVVSIHIIAYEALKKTYG